MRWGRPGHSCRHRGPHNPHFGCVLDAYLDWLEGQAEMERLCLLFQPGGPLYLALPTPLDEARQDRL